MHDKFGISKPCFQESGHSILLQIQNIRNATVTNDIFFSNKLLPHASVNDLL